MVKLAAGVLAVLAIGMFVTGAILGFHDAHDCRADDYGDMMCDSSAEGIFAVRVFSFGAGGSLAVAALVLVMYLKQTGPNPPR